jgi:hypothetical protein
LNGSSDGIKWKELNGSNRMDWIDQMGGNEWIKWEGMNGSNGRNYKGLNRSMRENGR